MSPITAAFVCALCDPDNPRPASIMCSNNCGRYVCAIHAMPRRGPGSAMVCLACAEALGLVEISRPATPAEVTPLVEIKPEPAPVPAVETGPATSRIEPVAAAAAVETMTHAEPGAAALKEESGHEPIVTPPAAAAAASTATMAQHEDAAVITPKAAAPAPQEPVVIDNVAPAGSQSTAARRLTEPEPMPAQKSITSETVVSQRGNTLQVPKVSSGLGKPPQPISNVKPRKAQRAVSTASNVDWRMVGMVAGTVLLGILGFVLILSALSG